MSVNLFASSTRMQDKKVSSVKVIRKKLELTVFLILKAVKLGN